MRRNFRKKSASVQILRIDMKCILTDSSSRCQKSWRKPTHRKYDILQHERWPLTTSGSSRHWKGSITGSQYGWKNGYDNSSDLCWYTIFLFNFYVGVLSIYYQYIFILHLLWIKIACLSHNIVFRLKQAAKTVTSCRKVWCC